MAEMSTPRRMLMRTLYVALALALMIFRLLPLDTAPSRWAGPDLLVALTFAWTMRRPDHVPALSIAGVMFLADLMLQRPPGLMAALVLLGAEYLRSRALASGEISFAREWLAVALTLLAILAANRIVLAILDVPRAQLSLGLMQTGFTIAAYPLVVLLSRAALGVRRLGRGEAFTARARP